MNLSYEIFEGNYINLIFMNKNFKIKLTNLRETLNIKLNNNIWVYEHRDFNIKYNNNKNILSINSNCIDDCTCECEHYYCSSLNHNFLLSSIRIYDENFMEKLENINEKIILDLKKRKEQQKKNKLKKIELEEKINKLKEEIQKLN